MMDVKFMCLMLLSDLAQIITMYVLCKNNTVVKSNTDGLGHSTFLYSISIILIQLPVQTASSLLQSESAVLHAVDMAGGMVEF